MSHNSSFPGASLWSCQSSSHNDWGDNSIEQFWLEFLLEIPLEISFQFCAMPKPPLFELFIGVGNPKPKLNWFLESKMFSIE